MMFSKRPFIFLNMAASLDGKINTKETTPILLGTPYDRRIMEGLRSRADAILIGSKTVKGSAPPAIIRHGSLLKQRLKKGMREQPINIVMSHNLDFSKKLPYFRNRSKETLWIFTTPAAPSSKLRFWDKKARIFLINAPVPSPQQVAQALYQAGIRKLLVEGGGEIAFSFLKENLLDEIHITLCPKIIGGKNAPSLFSGEGFTAKQMKNLRLLHVRRVGNELFLHYKVR